MNKYGYAWGLFGFLSATQICEGSQFLIFLFGAISFVCLIISLSQDKD